MVGIKAESITFVGVFERLLINDRINSAGVKVDQLVPAQSELVQVVVNRRAYQFIILLVIFEQFELSADGVFDLFSGIPIEYTESYNWVRG